MKKIIIVAAALTGCSLPPGYQDQQQDNLPSGIEIVPSQSFCTEGDALPLSVVYLFPDGTRAQADLLPLQLRSGSKISADVNRKEIRCIQEGTDSLEAISGNLYSKASFTVKKKQNYSALKISEVMYDPVKEDSGKEFIEIINTGSSSVDLSGCVLIDGSHSSAGFVIPQGTVIASGSRAAAAQSDQAFLSAYGRSPDCVPFLFTLNNSGETVFLYSPSGELLDTVYIEGGSAEFPVPESWGGTEPKAAEGNSISRQNPFSDTDRASDWQENQPSPGM